MLTGYRVPRRRDAFEGRVRAGIRLMARLVARSCAVLLAATGITVATGLLGEPPVSSEAGLASLSAQPTSRPIHDELARRELAEVSRSSAGRIAAARKVKSHEAADTTGTAVRHRTDLSRADPHQIARTLMPRFGFSGSEYTCLVRLWNSESGWKVHADNPTTHAYGIPQALPGSKMTRVAPDWRNNPETQIRWGLGYIKASYGTPCSAWSFKRTHDWY